MADLRAALSKIRIPSRGGVTVLRSIPLIAEIEAMLVDRSVEWSSAFEAACDRASIALFGVTRADTLPIEPHPDRMPDPHGTPCRFSDQAFDAYNAALGEWWAVTQAMQRYEIAISDRGAAAYWRQRGYDIQRQDTHDLRCFRQFDRQLHAAVAGVLPSARVTLDGAGKRAAQSAEEWGAALARQAATFRPSR